MTPILSIFILVNFNSSTSRHVMHGNKMQYVSDVTASLPYHEPGIVTILVLSSFLLLLNFVNFALDKIVYCGLLGQVFLGVAWGSPGAKWLDSFTEKVIVQLGYLGLLLLVYEGELGSTLMVNCRANRHRGDYQHPSKH